MNCYCPPRVMTQYPCASLAALVGAFLFGCSSDGSPAALGKDGHDASAEAGAPPNGSLDASAEAAASDSATRTDGGSSPTVTCPITGGKLGLPFNSMPAGLAQQYGYDESECFLSGVAHANGAPSITASYKTRILVRRPSDPSKFNGTVFVEWLNVSLGADVDVDFAEGHAEFLRGGYAYVGVSAQVVGVEGGTPAVAVPNVTPQPLKKWDPDRYGSLSHPGDQYANDIFAQAGAAIGGLTPGDPLSGLVPKHVIASGDSQSADRLTDYLNGGRQLVFDGFLIHSRTNGMFGARLPDGAPVPVLQFVTETELSHFSFATVRQTDAPHLRTWEVAGTSHVDRTTADYLKGEGDRFAPDAGVDFASSCMPVNTGPHAYVFDAAIAALTAWVAGGTPPASTEPIQIGDAGVIVRDGHGNALGGVRSPSVDVPIAALSADNPDPNLLCQLFGSTTPFDAATLSSLYTSRADYVSKVTTAAQAAVAAGHLLQADESLIEQAAQNSSVP